jgi:hypothetical protein
MREPLDGARLKVVRAQHHLETLKDEIGAYVDKQPYQIVAETDSDGVWRVGPAVTIQPPLPLSTIIGDCVTNARAALDYITWQLALKYFPKPFDRENARKWVAFPIVRDPAHQNLVRRVNGFADRAVPALAIDEIKAVQPYNTGYEPMGWLEELVNEDKHRLPVLTIGHLVSADVDVFMKNNGEYGLVGQTGNSLAFLGFPAGYLPTQTPDNRGYMQVKGKATGFVAFEDVTMPREPVDRTLEQIIETVSNIIPRFDCFFV